MCCILVRDLQLCSATVLNPQQAHAVSKQENEDRQLHVHSSNSNKTLTLIYTSS